MLAVSQNENDVATTIPTMPRDDRDLLAARAICCDVRQALEAILSHVTSGARDLRDGLPWSRNLEQFELVSMEQARALAQFPISVEDERFGVLVHRARASFIAFRETVRREIIGVVDHRTDNAAYDLALNKVNGRSVLADESLKSVEQAITRYWPVFPPALQTNDSLPQIGGEASRPQE